MDKKRHRGYIYEAEKLGARAADKITAFVGSWAFMFLHMLWFSLWISLRVEPFPYGLLTMIVSLEAIFLSTLVMMSQNRQADRDRTRDDHEASEVDELFQINQHQTEILERLDTLENSITHKVSEAVAREMRKAGLWR